MKYVNLLKNSSKFNIINFLLIISLFFVFDIQNVFAAVTISTIPNEVVQGEPVLIQISGAKMIDIKKLTFNNKKLNIFNYKNIPSALVGVDLRGKSGDLPIYLELKSGSSTSATLTVKDREKIEQVMEVPESLGGNSPENQTKVVNTLVDENALLAVIKTFTGALWTKKFIYPVSNPIITDEYGYSRQTGAYNLAHKGVDFKAKAGTKVFAMNRGIVRVTKKFKIYGDTVVIDHGYGVMSFYLHLSKIKVNVGELVQQGQLIGLSGNSGYVIGPHLHLSIRINNVSIDPIKFLELFK